VSQIHLGEVLPFDLPTFQLTLSPGMVFLWRETSSRAEGLFWEPGIALPSGWRGSIFPWKIIGIEIAVAKLWKEQSPPQGSRSIIVERDCRLQVNFAIKLLRWSGVRKKRVLIVDDSSTLRKLLRHVIEGFGDWHIIGELESAEALPSFLDHHFPDLVTLDLHLGNVDGAEAMRRFLAPRRVPTLLITSQPKEDGGLVLEALASGALDYLQKPESGKWDQLAEELKNKMDSALKARWQQQSTAFAVWKPIEEVFATQAQLIAIGSSTGGTQALQDILLTMPREIPPILITQHIPPVFSKALADRLNAICPFEVKEGEDGDEVLPNRVLIAPGGHHMRLASGGRKIVIESDEPINRFRPSVDALFYSVAKNAKVPVTAALLTGMGKDGALGLLQLKNNGAYTIAQDEASSVVFGMPKEAIELGAALKVEPLHRISRSFVEASRLHKKTKSLA
jgi:two-component system chemotaxis response regulator CheB